jgi:hypothetical protein
MVASQSWSEKKLSGTFSPFRWPQVARRVPSAAGAERDGTVALDGGGDRLDDLAPEHHHQPVGEAARKRSLIRQEVIVWWLPGSAFCPVA